MRPLFEVGYYLFTGPQISLLKQLEQDIGIGRHIIKQSQVFSGKINACGGSFLGSSEDFNVITRGSIGLTE